MRSGVRRRLKRVFLFLQGVISPFFGRLSDRLKAQGHGVFRINFCAGDALIWGRRQAWHFRGGLADLPDYLETKFRRHGFTDIILFGDQRPIHRAAIEMAKICGARVLVFEEGYVRPNWVTLDRGGVNAHSSLPRDPYWYRAVDGQIPRYGDGQPAPSNLGRRAADDMAYHCANLLNPLIFRAFRTHRPHSAATEYAGWVRRFARLPRRQRRDGELIRHFLRLRKRYFFLPLQLNSDVQIRRHSHYSGMNEVIEDVMRSLARSAPSETHLIIKNHPLDTGLSDYARLIGNLERELDLVGRVHYVETGHLPALLQHALGVVTVNSTTGMSALVHDRPTLALGNAIYDLPGLSHQGDLDSFWTECSPPDAALFAAFRNAVIHTTQVNGNFYDVRGIGLALEGCPRLLHARSPLDELLS